MFSTAHLKEAGLFRELRNIEQSGYFLTYQDKKYLNLSSNDYLGISSRMDLQEAFFKDLLSGEQFLMSSLSSRLLTGNSPAFSELETFLATQYGKEACLVFNSGYHANIGILPALSGKKDLILADKLVHASIIDGLRLCECRWMRFKHNDYTDLTRLLEKYRNDYERVFIVTESIFSMEGDCADLQQLVEIKRKYEALLYVDEAHGVGVRGDRGLGLSEESGYAKDIDFIVCTLGKAIASEGAFLVCNEDIKQYLVNSSRSFIFTTAMPPLQVKWTRYIVEKMMEMKPERTHLQRLTSCFRNALVDKHLLGDTHIVPMLVEDNNDCLRYAQQLQNKGIWAMAVRYPTVPVNKARIRFSLTAAFSYKQIRDTYEAILVQ